MFTSTPTHHSLKTLAIFMIASLFSTIAHAKEDVQEAKQVTGLKGVVKLPEEISSAINVEGLELNKAIAVLQGRFNTPRLPYPADWKEFTPDQRRAWLKEYKATDAYVEHQKKVEEAKAKRFRVTASVAADGSFSFSDLKPDWYSLEVMILHDEADGITERRYARAHVLRQFFIKDVEQDHNLGDSTFTLKNVILPGITAPDFTLFDYEGKEFRLSDFRGKYVLFDFWATWCMPCIAEIPNLVAVHEKYGAGELVVMGIAIDQKIEEPKAFLEKRSLPYTQGYLPPKFYKTVRETYGIRTIPSIWLIDPEGKIIARDLHGKKLKEAVDKVMSPQ